MSKDIRGFVSLKEMKLEGRIIQISSEKIMNRKVCALLQLYLQVTSDNKQTGRPGLRERVVMCRTCLAFSITAV